MWFVGSPSHLLPRTFGVVETATPTASEGSARHPEATGIGTAEAPWGATPEPAGRMPH